MIRRFLHIKSFGVFEDFQWPSGLPDFKQFNLIYGWNYSGKTTLSRAFRCFEQQQHHEDFTEAQVQIKNQDETVHYLSTPHTAPLIRVFNSDFMRDNLGFDEGSASPILVLSAENITKQGALKMKATEREELAQSKLQAEGQRREIQTAIDGALTRYARDLIKNPLGVPSYDRTRFEPKVIACKANPEGYLLDDNALEQCLLVFRSTEKKSAMSAKVVSLSSIEQLKEKTTSLLDRVVTAHNPIPRLQSNPDVERWVEKGRVLHEGKETCQFCGQLLPHDLITHLAGHFSADYENMMTELKAMVNEVQVAQEEKVTLDHKGEFYPELSERYITERDQLDELLRMRKSALSRLEEVLTVKQSKAFTKLACPSVDNNSTQIGAAVEGINKLISEHNARTAEFEKKRQESFVKLESHYAALFIREEEYNKRLLQIDTLKTTITNQNTKLGELDTEVRALEQELSEASKGAERINELLAAYFGKDDLRIEVSSDKRFQIKRGDAIAKNLSEGEKTAIAFAHFITSIQDGRNPLEDTIVVIDDPISSLDANHLFNTYALIKIQLASCRQLFISTHSFEFYSLIRDWVADDEGNRLRNKPQSEWMKWGVYLVKRSDDGKAVLEEIPKELLRFKSEYHYLFSVLYHFDKAAAGDFDCLLGLPNMVRRFMEAFGGIMIPLSTGLRGKMERLFPDEVERERVWKFINYYSHNTTINRSLSLPDVSECRAIVKSCLKAVQAWDGNYYDDIESEVT
ncbi:MAG TPA: AAA family ATPase [Mariprofundaceae bacterium]|nr:AAA family ATPase [Mariprofundaceae bacterium]